MTKVERDKCEELMFEAISIMKETQKEYAEAERHKEAGNIIEWVTAHRNADLHYGEVCGINQVLATIGFRHEKMKELSELL